MTRTIAVHHNRTGASMGRIPWTFRASTLALLSMSVLLSTHAQVVTAQKDNLFRDDFAGFSTYPVASQGFLVSYMRNVSPGGSTNIRVTRMDTGEHITVPFRAGAAAVVLIDASMTRSGRLVVVGDQSTQGKPATGFIRLLDMAGNTIAESSTDSYIPTRACEAADGSVWTLGQVQPDSPTNAYPLLRNYTADGQLKQSALSRNTIAAPINVFPRGQVFGQTGITKAHLSCGDGAVGVYVGSPANIWSEVSMASGAVRQVKVKPVKGGMITSLVFMQPGTVFGTFQFADTTQRTGLFRLNDHAGTSEWVPVSDLAQNASGPVMNILGRDGPNVIYSRENSDRGRLFWGPIQ